MRPPDAEAGRERRGALARAGPGGGRPRAARPPHALHEPDPRAAERRRPRASGCGARVRGSARTASGRRSSAAAAGTRTAPWRSPARSSATWTARRERRGRRTSRTGRPGPSSRHPHASTSTGGRSPPCRRRTAAGDLARAILRLGPPAARPRLLPRHRPRRPAPARDRGRAGSSCSDAGGRRLTSTRRPRPCAITARRSRGRTSRAGRRPPPGRRILACRARHPRRALLGPREPPAPPGRRARRRPRRHPPLTRVSALARPAVRPAPPGRQRRRARRGRRRRARARRVPRPRPALASSTATPSTGRSSGTRGRPSGCRSSRRSRCSSSSRRASTRRASAAPARAGSSARSCSSP